MEYIGELYGRFLERQDMDGDLGIAKKRWVENNKPLFDKLIKEHHDILPLIQKWIIDRDEENYNKIVDSID